MRAGRARGHLLVGQLAIAAPWSAGPEPILGVSPDMKRLWPKQLSWASDFVSKPSLFSWWLSTSVKRSILTTTKWVTGIRDTYVILNCLPLSMQTRCYGTSSQIHVAGQIKSCSVGSSEGYLSLKNWLSRVVFLHMVWIMYVQGTAFFEPSHHAWFMSFHHLQKRASGLWSLKMTFGQRPFQKWSWTSRVYIYMLHAMLIIIYLLYNIWSWYMSLGIFMYPLYTHIYIYRTYTVRRIW